MDAKHDTNTSSSHGVRWRHLALLLFIVPFIGTLWVASYASLTPALWGIPFFYWYQFLWIGIGAALTIIVYLVERSGDAPRTERRP